MLNLNSIMISTSQVEIMAQFYKDLLGRDADMIDGNWHGWQIGNCFVTIGDHSEIKGPSKEAQRIIINLETSEVDMEFDRIKDIQNVKIVKEPYEMGGMTIATFADPDGNYLQLMTPWNEDSSEVN
jgi:predicted enzyme related to lactoylglutathione lyase